MTNLLATKERSVPILIDETPPGLFCMECLDDLSGRYHLRMQIVGHSAVGLLPEGLEPIQVTVCGLHVTNKALIPFEGLRAQNNRSKGHLAMRLQRVSVEPPVRPLDFCGRSWGAIKLGYDHHLLDGNPEAHFLDIGEVDQALAQAYCVLHDELRLAVATHPFWRKCWRTFLGDVRKTNGQEQADMMVSKWGEVLPRIERWRNQNK